MRLVVPPDPNRQENPGLQPAKRTTFEARFRKRIPITSNAYSIRMPQLSDPKGWHASCRTQAIRDATYFQGRNLRKIAQTTQ